MELKNKTIILTGAARVGVAVADMLLAASANLVVVYRTHQPDIKSDKILFVKGELSQQNDAEVVIEAAKKQFGAIHGLVHMAASYERVPWDKLSVEAWNSSMDAIAKSAFITAKLVADEMRRNDGEVKGKIILISDWSVLSRPYKDYLVYNTAKAAIVGLAKSLAKELAPDILVNCIAPGPILRPPDLSDEENQEALAGTPLNRWGGADEIAKAVQYLMDADFVTGQELFVDGGRSIA